MFTAQHLTLQITSFALVALLLFNTTVIYAQETQTVPETLLHDSILTKVFVGRETPNGAREFLEQVQEYHDRVYLQVYHVQNLLTAFEIFVDILPDEARPAYEFFYKEVKIMLGYAEQDLTMTARVEDLLEAELRNHYQVYDSFSHKFLSRSELMGQLRVLERIYEDMRFARLTVEEFFGIRERFLGLQNLYT